MKVSRARPPWPGDAANRDSGWHRYSPHHRRKLGLERLCRLCGRGGLPDNRFTWHPRCGKVAGTAVYPNATTQWLMRRQRGLCATCPAELAEFKDDGYYGEQWHAHTVKVSSWVSSRVVIEIDHIIPLWRVALMPRQRQGIRYWLAGNLQALCMSCHRDKTRSEAAERARSRRGPR